MSNHSQRGWVVQLNKQPISASACCLLPLTDRQPGKIALFQAQGHYFFLDLWDPDSLDPSVFLLQMTGSPAYSGSSWEEYLT